MPLCAVKIRNWPLASTESSGSAVSRSLVHVGRVRVLRASGLVRADLGAVWSLTSQVPELGSDSNALLFPTPPGLGVEWL